MNIEEQIPSFVIESICCGCNEHQCDNHQEKKIFRDSVTGLVIEAKCVCTHGE